MRFKRTDENQRGIVTALRGIGASVTDLSAVGDGCPDLLVGWFGQTYLLEVKRPLGPRGGTAGKDKRLRPSQEVWHGGWRGGPVLVVRSPDEALLALGLRHVDDATISDAGPAGIH